MLFVGYMQHYFGIVFFT